MDRENILKLATIQSLFNKFFRNGRRFFGDVLESWIMHADAKKRLFGITRTAFKGLADADRQNAGRLAKDQMDERYGAIFQRRHDCIQIVFTIVTAPAFHLNGLCWEARCLK
ncbi:MAG: hypothetical protein ACODAD_08860, partial [Planctomycetota bacterium]